MVATTFINHIMYACSHMRSLKTLLDQEEFQESRIKIKKISAEDTKVMRVNKCLKHGAMNVRH